LLKIWLNTTAMGQLALLNAALLQG